MIVYRLCKQKYINDLSGHGAEMNGGRWNGRGNPALYTSGSRALAVLEIAVHVPFGILPTNYYMMAIEMAKGFTVTKIDIPELPENWNRNPPIRATQYLGDDFLKENKNLILQVPSATVTGEFNYIFNPRHPEFKSVKIIMTDPFEFDSRLFKR
ncbi:MAG TPA: RES family NAD+ phosphorylase [Mucilaginibacter sp.]|jgi:RES domain-containing protein